MKGGFHILPEHPNSATLPPCVYRTAFSIGKMDKRETFKGDVASQPVRTVSLDPCARMTSWVQVRSRTH